MSIIRKSLAETTIADLDALIASEARETGELEFKGTLPFVPTKGQPATSDRWIEKGIASETTRAIRFSPRSLLSQTPMVARSYSGCTKPRTNLVARRRSKLSQIARG